MTIPVGAQQHEWLLTGTGGAMRAVMPDGSLQGSSSVYGTDYQWSLTPDDGD